MNQCPTCKWCTKRDNFSLSKRENGSPTYQYECMYDTTKIDYVRDWNYCRHYHERDGKWDWKKRKREYPIESKYI